MQNLYYRPVYVNHVTSWVTKCRLEDGSVVEYDACSEEPNAYDPKLYRYIGKGVIVEVDGVPQNFKTPHHFWVDA